MTPRLKALARFIERNATKERKKPTPTNRQKHVETTGEETATVESTDDLRARRKRQKTAGNRHAVTGAADYSRNREKPVKPLVTYTLTRRLNKSSCSGGFLYFPRNFCSDILKQDTDFHLEDEFDGKWPVKFLHHNCGHKIQGLSGGWGRFAKHHILKQGDELVMDLVQPTTTPLIFKVKVVKKDSSSEPNYMVATEANEKFHRRNTMDLGNEDVSHIHTNLHCASDLECEVQHGDADEHDGSSQPIQNRQVQDTLHGALEIASHLKTSRTNFDSKKIIEDYHEALEPLLSLSFVYGTDSEDDSDSSEYLEIDEDDRLLVCSDLILKSGSAEEAGDKLQIESGQEKKGGKYSTEQYETPDTVIKKSRTTEEADDKLLSNEKRLGMNLLIDYGVNNHNNRRPGFLKEPRTDYEYKFVDAGGILHNPDIMKKEKDKRIKFHPNSFKIRGNKREYSTTVTCSKSFKRARTSVETTSTDKPKRRGKRKGLERGYKSLLQMGSNTHDMNPHYPSFQIVMRSYHTSKAFFLKLPNEFCDIHLSRNMNRVDLEDEEGLRWEALYLHQLKAISAGWRSFAQDHKLREGDIAVFRLVDHTTFKVSIIAKGQASNMAHDLGGQKAPK